MKIFGKQFRVTHCRSQETNPSIIEFAYSIPTRTGMQEEVARVPVPNGKMDEAVGIVEHFRKK